MAVNDDPRPAGPRPGSVTTAVALLVVGGLLLITGGLIAATMTFDTLRHSAPATVPDDAVRDYARLYRGTGILFAVAGAALTALAARCTRRDSRVRRATVTLALAIVVIVAVAAVFSGTHILSLLSLLPIIVGTLLLSRPAMVEWYAGG